MIKIKEKGIEAGDFNSFFFYFRCPCPAGRDDRCEYFALLSSFILFVAHILPDESTCSDEQYEDRGDI